jgi:alkylated DNA repair dioxygenase AlkB
LSSAGVVSVSFGASRKFRIRDKATNNIVMDIPTNSNEILIMGGDFQKEFTHEVPVEKKITTARISFTFRKQLR